MKYWLIIINNFQRLPKGETGLLRHYDLINRGMVMAVQTDNLGFEVAEGFEIIGRWKKKKGKLEAEEIKGAHGGKVITQMVNFLLKRNLRKIGDVYSKIKRER